MTLSSFCLSLQDPIGKKLCEKLWDEQDQQKVVTLQLCFNEAINSYKRYQVNEYRKNLKIMENSIEINKTSYQRLNYSGNKNYNKNYNQGYPTATKGTPITRVSTPNLSASSVSGPQRFTIYINF